MTPNPNITPLETYQSFKNKMDGYSVIQLIHRYIKNLLFISHPLVKHNAKKAVFQDQTIAML